MTHRHLTQASWLVVLVLLACAVLDGAGRAGWSTRQHDTVAAVVGDHPAWTGVLIATATALALALALGRLRSYVMGAAGAWLALWGVALLWWATELPDPPVSVLGPILACAFGALGIILAHAWADREA